MDISINTQTIAISITILLIAITTLLFLNAKNQSKMPTSAEDNTSALHTTPIPTPTYGFSGYFTVLAKTFIPHNSPATVLSAIRDTKTWSQWNGFTPAFTFKGSSSIDSDSKSTPASGSATATSDPALMTGKPGWLDLGSEGAMTVFMNGDGLVEGSKKSREQGIIITVLEPLTSPLNSPQNEDQKKGYRIAWKSIGYAKWQLYSERVTELVEVNEGAQGRNGTEYVCWETFGGVLAPVVRLAVGGTLRERFGEYADGLRGFCGGRGGG
ncbi:hypothetical protein BKA64DRAFT_741705 [Cadophora sp. MPI-SDFR-AT-0126]|nr:hypothetical protein BKA64DRAFT_741705 [Leotiomycetes sp. MPI-SDFR-AT-0126]